MGYIENNLNYYFFRTDFDEKRVLNINVMNPLYPITIGVMQKICASFGKILRMMIFRKNGVQVMVEVTHTTHLINKLSKNKKLDNFHTWSN